MTVKYTLVDKEDRLAELVSVLNEVPGCALDTEADSMHHYRVRLCLIQITVAGKNWIVDPLSDINLNKLWQTKALQNLILHGADYDLRMLHTFCDFTPQKIFDTMIAARFLGVHRVGLSSLVKKYFSVTLAKSNQKADWTKRPLPKTMKQYAVLDTFYLHELREILLADLRKLGREEWHTQTCAHILQNSQEDIFLESDDDAWRIKKSNSLDPRALVFLRELWHWREKEGELLDRPVFKVLNNEALIGISRRAANNASNITAQTFNKLPRNFTGDRLRRFLNTLHRAAKIPQKEWPEPKARRLKLVDSPNAKHLESIRNYRDKIALELEIDPTIIANRNQMVNLAMPNKDWENKIKLARLLPWQWEMLKPGIN
ncbi:MAG: ribonuclease D [Fibrobacter sp.]|nr:ribonuclease D [Fibrobacter sp.]